MNEQFIDRVLELVNQARSEEGLAPLTLNEQLNIAADSHSQSMAVNDFFSHQDPTDNSSGGDRIEETGYEWSFWGENVAAGYSTPEQVVDGWLNSPGHRANILNENFTEIGIGYEFLEDDTGNINYNHYWTQVFAQPLPGSNDDPLLSNTLVSDLNSEPRNTELVWEDRETVLTGSIFDLDNDSSLVLPDSDYSPGYTSGIEGGYQDDLNLGFNHSESESFVGLNSSALNVDFDSI